MGDFLTSSTVNVHRRPTVNVPAVIKMRKGVLIKCVTYTQQIVIVLLALEQNIAQVSCKTGKIIKRFT